MIGRPEKYISASGISSTELQRFLTHGRNVFPKIETSYDMMLGHAFEAYLRGDFSERFFVTDFDTSWPSKLRVSDIMGGKIPEKIFCKPDKEGNRKLNKKYANLHMWIDACEEYPGRFPVAQSDYDTIIACADSLKLIPVTDFMRIGDMLDFSEWSKEVYWDSVSGSEICKKKALYDLKFRADGIYYVCDIKLYSSFQSFRSWLKGGGWIQQIHYSEGAMAEFSADYDDIRFIFLVGSKTEKIAHLIEIERPLDHLWEKYQMVCDDLTDWDSAGRPVAGYGVETVKVWV